jgi:hypothetical protein
MLPAPPAAPAAGFYVSGDEKTMVLTATDFCLIPSRWVLQHQA